MNKIKKGLKILTEKGPAVFMSKVANLARLILTPLYVSVVISASEGRIIKEITDFSSGHRSKMFDFIFKKYLGVFSAMQIKNEFMKLLEIVEARRPKYVLEIGTANGGALFCFSRLSSDDATILSVDLPEGRFGGGYEEWRMPFFEAFKKGGQKQFLFRADSHEDSTLALVKDTLKDQKLDFLFIDGDHTYEGVKKDFEMYSPLVKNGGVVAFHDIVNGPEDYVGGVPRFWREIKPGHEYREFVESWEQGGYGIGVLFLT